jgi:ubiquinone/menaquinone biosynthesis C-methylase UbiE
MNALDLKLKDNSFNAVTCFEILEHVDQEGQNKLLAESARVLKDDGTLYISSPNASVYPFLRSFHLKELTMVEFEHLLRKFYKNVEIFGQDLMVDGIRQKKSLNKHDSKLFYDNFIIVKDDIESCYGLLAICKNKIKLNGAY